MKKEELKDKQITGALVGSSPCAYDIGFLGDVFSGYVSSVPNFSLLLQVGIDLLYPFMDRYKSMSQ